MIHRLVSPTLAAAALFAAGSLGSVSALAGTVARGELRTVAPRHDTHGAVSLVQTNGEAYLVLGDDFSTVHGPDLRVTLYRTPPAGGRPEYIDLGALGELAGGQVYRIPPNLPAEALENVAIWCRHFDVLFGAARLGGR